MIPLRDNIPSRSTPFVNYLMIAACTLVFLRQFMAEEGPEQLVEAYGMIPVRVLHPYAQIQVPAIRPVQTAFGSAVTEGTRDVPRPAVHPWLTLLTCIFLHGGLMHVLGNMWFLYIFGDNVEDRLGHVGYLLFYLGSGVAASAVHLATNASSPVPTIGASGAIAGVMGAYFLLYPHARVVTVVPIVFFLHVVVLPAPIFLGVWFGIQFFHGTMPADSTGVAWWAHIGGFVVGFCVAWMLRQRFRPGVRDVLPYTERSSHYRLERDHNPWNYR